MTHVAFLNYLPETMRSRGIRRSTLSDLTAIDPGRIAEIASLTHEPWLDEAHAISRALCTDGIMPLIASGDLTASDLHFGIPMPDDIDQLRAGRRLPLSVACRIAARLGVGDPAELIVTPLQQQLWSIIASGERLPAPGNQGFCPWCAEPTYAHRDTCLAEALWGERDRSRFAAMSPAPHPLRPGKGRRASGRAKGLRHQRDIAGKTPQDIYAATGIRPDYLSKLENERLNLTLEKAEAIARLLGCDVALLYALPAGTPPQVTQ